MKDIALKLRAALAVLALALAFMLPSEGALAQTVTKLPVFVTNTPNTVTDLGNGPLELKVLLGNALVWTSQGAGVGSTSGSSTALTLTGTPTTPPCVGCVISGTSITSGTTVISFNGTTTVGLSAAMTVAAGTAVAWGAACPSTVGAVAGVQLGVSNFDVPWYTQARLCAAGQNGPGGVLVPFAIGAH